MQLTLLIKTPGVIEDALKVLIDAGCEREKITVLHCNTEYPTPFEDVNLRAMLTIKTGLSHLILMAVIGLLGTGPWACPQMQR